MSTMTVYSNRIELQLENRSELDIIINKLDLFKIPYVYEADENEILIDKNNFTYDLLYTISNITRSLILI